MQSCSCKKSFCEYPLKPRQVVLDISDKQENEEKERTEGQREGLVGEWGWQDWEQTNKPLNRLTGDGGTDESY